MGKIVLVARLAARDVRRHQAQAVLLLLAITAATTTLVLGLALNGVTSHPYQQTRASTNGPDLVAGYGVNLSPTSDVNLDPTRGRPRSAPHRSRPTPVP